MSGYGYQIITARLNDKYDLPLDQHGTSTFLKHKTLENSDTYENFMREYLKKNIPKKPKQPTKLPIKKREPKHSKFGHKYSSRYRSTNTTTRKPKPQRQAKGIEWEIPQYFAGFKTGLAKINGEYVSSTVEPEKETKTYENYNNLPVYTDFLNGDEKEGAESQDERKEERNEDENEAKEEKSRQNEEDIKYLQ